MDPSGKNWNGCPKPNPYASAWAGLQTKFKKVCADNYAIMVACYRRCRESNVEKEAECLCKHGSGDPKYPVHFECLYDEKDCHSALLGNQGACILTTQGTTSTDCSMHIGPNNPSCSGVDFEQAFLHEAMHCCGARHHKRPKGEAAPDCPENCLRPFFGWPNHKQGWPGWPSDFENLVGCKSPTTGRWPVA